MSGHGHEMGGYLVRRSVQGLVLGQTAIGLACFGAALGGLLGAGAPSAVAAAACPNEAVRLEQRTTNLPECRAYEQVSPADKNGYPVYWKPKIGDKPLINIGLDAVARDGEAAVFSSWGVFAGSENSLIQTYRSRRTGSGWVTTPGSPAINAYHPDAGGNPAIPAWRAASSDLEEGLIDTSNSWSPLDTNALSGPLSASDLYIRNAADETLLASAGADGTAVGGIDASEDAMLARQGGHALFVSRAHVTPEDAGSNEGTPNLYEWDDGVTRLVSVAPGGGPADAECGSGPVVLGPHVSGAVGASQSSDGTRVVFQTSGGAGNNQEIFCMYFIPSRLFVRVDGSRTVPISASQRSEPDPAGPLPPSFAGASRDLSRIFFTSQGKLTDDADRVPEGTYLYEFDLGSETLSALAGEVQRVWAVSADGSTIYFARGSSLYRLSGGEEELIATSPSGAIEAFATTRAVDVASEDGDSLLFLAAQDLTGYESQEHNEVYLYRVGQPLRCLSCGVGAAEPPSHAHITLGEGESVGGGEAGRYADSLSSDGSLVAFDTGAALLPADTNDRRDVYEYDADRNKLALVSDGTTQSDSYVYGMSRSGRDIFFVTNASLLRQDTDQGAEDLYDARSGGGFPAGGGEATLDCGGEACLPPPSRAPQAQGPGSSQLSAPGNKPRRSARCAKARHGKRAKASARKARCARKATAPQSHRKGR